MDKFGNIKALCSYFSRCYAIECANETGVKIIIDDADLNITSEIIIELAKMVRDRGFWVPPDNIGSHDGSRLTFDFKIYKESIFLFPFASYLDKSFSLKADGGKVDIIFSPNADFPPILEKTYYFIGGDSVWGVDTNAPEPVLEPLVQPLAGICSKKDRHIGLSIEFRITPKVTLHELTHLKWPKEIPETEEAVDRVATAVHANINPILSTMKNKKGKRDLFKREFRRISRDFEALDLEVGRVLAIQ